MLPNLFHSEEPFKLEKFSLVEGDNNEERSFKTVLPIDTPLQGRCLQQIGALYTRK